ncbi:MAG: hypothetical protein PVG41_15900, partial [Desulfobacteraceae bacterium]
MRSSIWKYLLPLLLGVLLLVPFSVSFASATDHHEATDEYTGESTADTIEVMPASDGAASGHGGKAHSAEQHHATTDSGHDTQHAPDHHD